MDIKTNVRSIHVTTIIDGLITIYHVYFHLYVVAQYHFNNDSFSVCMLKLLLSVFMSK